MSGHGSAAVRSAVQASPHAFSADDFEPRAIGASQKQQSKKRSSVFVSGGDWASQSSRAILDALHDLSATEAANSDEAKSQLPFMRNAGSMMVDGEDADLFDAESVRAVGPGKKNNSHIVECVHCRRPVLTTRFSTHLRVCSKFDSNDGIRKDSTKLEDDVSSLDKVDAELNLVSAPYESRSLCDARRLSDSFGNDESLGGETLIVEVSLPYFSGSPADVCTLQKRGCQWQKRLTPLLPVRGARRGRTRRLPKMPLIPLTEPPLPKKKQNTTEKRVLSAAASLGLGRIPASREENDVFKFAGRDWGIMAPWAKLMKIARPTFLPRAHIRRGLAPKETPLTLFMKAPDSSSQILQADSETAKMVPLRVNTRIAKAVTKPAPSLPGALLYIRGKYHKNLQHTSLGAMDISHQNVPKSPHMFHGQTYVAQPGTYVSDYAAGHVINLPTSVVDNAAAFRNLQQRAGVAGKGQSSVVGGTRSTGAGSPSPQQPPTKRQRVVKQQPRAIPANHGIGNVAGVPPKQPQNAQRKMPPQRQVTNAALANQKIASAKLQQQFAQQRGTIPNVPGSVNSAIAAAASAMNMKRTQGQPAQVKRQFRNQAGSAIPPNAINAAALSTAQVNAGKLAASAAAIPKGPIRGGRGRQQHAVPLNGTAQAHNMMHHGNPVLNAFQQPNPALANRGGPNMGGRVNASGLDAYFRGSGPNSSTAMPHGSGLNYQHELAQVVTRAGNAGQDNGRPTSRAPVGNRSQHRPMHELDRVQAQRQFLAQLNSAAQGQMGIPRQSAAIMGRFNQPQARQTEAQRQSPTVSGALTGRQNGQIRNPAQMFSGQQMGNALGGMYNPGFPVPVPNPHDRVSSQAIPQSMPLSAQNAANLAIMQMIQGRPGGPLPNQIPSSGKSLSGPSGARTGIQDMRAMQGFSPGLGVQNNMMNYFPGAGDPGNQNFAALATARMANNPLVPGMIPTDSIMSHIMPNPRQGPHPNMMHIPQASLGTATGSLLPTNTAATTSASQALSDIDKALSLDQK